MPEIWERRKYPSDVFGSGDDNPVQATRTISYDDRDNVTLTRAEVEGLLRLGNYEKRKS
ncbi:MAG: hypothetical protein ACTICQ_15175 [Glutamicibacter arilaitensis]|uniref:hypothetical protein n=1 Tax=Glutamicibacter arilaitensis TaxID=256701 RepID=UPI003FB92B2B